MDEKVIDTHDVIVIGAGLGGLGAACQLALEKKDVLLLEKHNVPGGFATSFIRGRFEFEGALHELSDVGTKENPGGLYTFFEEIGLIPDKVQFKQVSEFYRSVFRDDDLDVTMPFGVDKYFNKLIELFPKEKKNIEQFKEICLKIQMGLQYVAEKGGKINPLVVLMKHSWLARVAGLTLGEVFEKFFKNKRLIGVISQLWGYVGLPPSRLNAVIFIAMVMSYLKKGAVFPIGRSHALSSGMVKCFEEMGGTVRYNALVNRILVRNGGIYGVELSNGDIYKCNYIISNVNPICTTMKMLPQEIVPDSYIKKIYAPEIGNSGFSVYIGLNASPEKLGLTAHETFINENDDMDSAFEKFHRLETPDYIVAACYNQVYNEISPPRTTQLVLTTLQYGNVWHNVAPDEYYKTKDWLADSLISMVEETICPDLRAHIEVAEAATPLTYYRYSKNLDGAIYGYTQSIYDSPVFRLKSEGAIPGLYSCGAWTNVGGGYSPSIDSGRIATRMLIEDLKRGRF